MDINMQSKILRVLEEKKVRRIGCEKDVAFDVRIISAVNEKPEVVLNQGKVRTDLYYQMCIRDRNCHTAMLHLTHEKSNLENTI